MIMQLHEITKKDTGGAIRYTCICGWQVCASSEKLIQPEVKAHHEKNQKKG